jgi:Flp pilus assembly protein TadG
MIHAARQFGTLGGTSRRRCAGSALVEFALIAPVMLLLLAGVLNYGMALRTATAVASAARVAAQYGSHASASTTDTAGIRAAAINSAPTTSGMTVTSNTSCLCQDRSSVSCTGSCGSGKMLMYVNVTVRATGTAFLRIAGVPFTGAVSAQASMRAK